MFAGTIHRVAPIAACVRYSSLAKARREAEIDEEVAMTVAPPASRPPTTAPPMEAGVMPVTTATSFA